MVFGKQVNYRISIAIIFIANCSKGNTFELHRNGFLEVGETHSSRIYDILSSINICNFSSAKDLKNALVRYNIWQLLM